MHAGLDDDKGYTRATEYCRFGCLDGGQPASPWHPAPCVSPVRLCNRPRRRSIAPPPAQSVSHVSHSGHAYDVVWPLQSLPWYSVPWNMHGPRKSFASQQPEPLYNGPSGRALALPPCSAPKPTLIQTNVQCLQLIPQRLSSTQQCDSRVVQFLPRCVGTTARSPAAGRGWPCR